MSDISDNGLKDSVEKPRPAPLLTWAVTIAACAYFVWSGISLYYSVGIFANMFASMGVALHLSTMLVLGSYRLFLPLVFGGAVVMVIGKQFFVRDKWTSLAITLGVTVVLEFVSNVVVQALYSPLYDLVDKLSK
jgi:hypothetical protein